MFLEPRELFFYQKLNYFLVDAGTCHVLIIVEWHKIFDDAAKSPESLLFRHYLKETSDNKVEALTVANVDIAVRVGAANTLNSVQDLLSKLLLQSIISLVLLLVVFEECLIRKGPRHINCNLVSVCRWISCVHVFDQCKVVCITLG
jgi:hypothetical protein